MPPKKVKTFEVPDHDVPKFIDSMENVVELLKKKTKKDDAAAAIVLGSVHGPWFGENLEAVDPAHLTRQQHRILDQADYGNIYAVIDGDKDKKVDVAQSAGFVGKRLEKSTAPQSSHGRSRQLQTHTGKLRRVVQFFASVQECKVIRDKDTCTTVTEGDAAKCLWKDDLCTDAPALSAAKIRNAAAKLREKRLELASTMEVLRGNPNFATFTVNMPMPHDTMQASYYRQYKYLKDKEVYLRNQIKGLEVAASTSQTIIAEASEEFERIRGLEAECGLHKTFGNCTADPRCLVWKQVKGSSGGESDDTSNKSITDPAMCIPDGAMEIGRITKDSNNKLYFWDEVGHPDRITTDRELGRFKRAVGFLFGTSDENRLQKATELADKYLDQALIKSDDETQMLPAAQARMIQRRLYGLDMRLRSRLADGSADSSQSITDLYDGKEKYREGVDGKDSQKLLDMYKRLLARYTELVEDIRTDNEALADDILSVQFQTGKHPGLVKALQLNRTKNVEAKRKLEFAVEAAAYNFTDGETVRYYYYNDEESSGENSALNIESLDPRQTGIVMVKVLGNAKLSSVPFNPTDNKLEYEPPTNAVSSSENPMDTMEICFTAKNITVR